MTQVGTTTVEAGTTPVFVATPTGTPRGGLVVVQEAFGINPHIQQVTCRLAAAGWVAAAPHLFWRADDPVFTYEGQLDAVMRVMGTLTREDISTDIDAALAVLRDRGLDNHRCAVIGFCMGGTVAFAAASTHALGAAVSFYGGGVREGRFGVPALIDLAPELRTPWLGLYGDLDEGIPVADVEALRTAALRAPVPTEVVRYPGAGHGFNCDARSSYHQPSAHDAWNRMMQWLEAHIEPA